MNQSRSLGRAAGSAVLALSLLVAACGDSAESGSDTTSPSPTDGTGSTDAPRTTVAAPTGEPIVLYSIQNIGGPGNSAITAKLLLEQAAEDINAEGGIAGRPIEMVVCDDKEDPNEAEACARAAVEDGAVAIIATQTRNSPRVTAIAEQAGIPMIANSQITGPDYTSDVQFPILAGVLSLYAMAGYQAQDSEECEGRIAIIRTDSEATASLPAFANAGIEAAGGEPAPEVLIPVGAPDLAPQVNQAGDARCIVAITAEPGMLQFANAARQVGAEMKILANPSVLTLSAWESTGGADGPLEGSFVQNLLAPMVDPAWAEYRDVVAGLEGDRDVIEAQAPGFIFQQAWLSVYIVRALAEEIDGEITAASMLEQAGATSDLNSLLGELGTVMPPIDWTGDWEENPTFARNITRVVWPLQIVDGEYVSAGEPVDMTDVLLSVGG